MKFLHLSDLHLGKRLNGISMLSEQQYILMKILEIIDSEKIDCLLVAGDVYDKSVPPAEAVSLFDEFLTFVSQRGVKSFVISGNHDSAERIAFGSQIMQSSGVYMSPVFDGELHPATLTDEFGEINIYLLPFVKPVQVKRCFKDAEITDYNEALKTVIEHTTLDTDKRNVLVAHQFVTGAQRCESEEIFIGGLDNVDAEIFDGFDYVALGHIHSPQSVGRAEVRYCGTPLKYSFSEVNHRKSATVVEFGEKGSIKILKIPLIPQHDMRELRGKFEDVIIPENYKDIEKDDYLRVILTDEEEIPEGLYRLRSVYRNIMELSYDNTRSRLVASGENRQGSADKSPLENFSDLYRLQNGGDLSSEQRDYLMSVIEQIWEGEDEAD